MSDLAALAQLIASNTSPPEPSDVEEPLEPMFGFGVMVDIPPGSP